MFIFLVFYLSCIHSFSSGFQDVMDYDEVYKRLQELNNLLKQLVRNTNLQNREVLQYPQMQQGIGLPMLR